MSTRTWRRRRQRDPRGATRREIQERLSPRGQPQTVVLDEVTVAERPDVSDECRRAGTTTSGGRTTVSREGTGTGAPSSTAAVVPPNAASAGRTRAHASQRSAKVSAAHTGRDPGSAGCRRPRPVAESACGTRAGPGVAAAERVPSMASTVIGRVPRPGPTRTVEGAGRCGSSRCNEGDARLIMGVWPATRPAGRVRGKTPMINRGRGRRGQAAFRRASCSGVG